MMNATFLNGTTGRGSRDIAATLLRMSVKYPLLQKYRSHAALWCESFNYPDFMN